MVHRHDPLLGHCHHGLGHYAILGTQRQLRRFDRVRSPLLHASVRPLLRADEIHYDDALLDLADLLSGL